MKFILLALAASTCAPVASLGPRSLRNRSPDKNNEVSEADVAVISERELLSAWCAKDTPTMWHPNYAVAWSTGGCTFKADCDSPGYESELACCDGAYGGQVSGACKAGFANPSTTTTKWYADYATSWAIAGCKSAFPYPSYATTFFDKQLDCCKGAYGGQTSGACLAGLPTSPTMAPVTAGGVGGKWYADYGVAWSIAGCKNTFPYPNYAAIFYSSQLACCKGAFGGQTSNACIKGLPTAPTLLPTVAPTRKPTLVPTAAPTSKPTFEPTVTPSIIIKSEVTTIVSLGTTRPGMRQLQVVTVNDANYTNIFMETIQNLLTPILSEGESVLEVRIISFTPLGTGSLRVVFQIFLKELCTPGRCPDDKTSTTILDDKVIARINDTITSGEFAKEIKEETEEAILAREINATDPNTLLLTKLDENTPASVSITTVIFFTTAAPTNVPSKKPSSSPSVNPSSIPSTDPSGTPSSNPSGNPSSIPSTDPSSDPSTDPSSDPSTDPSSDPSSIPSIDPSSIPSADPSSDPSSVPSTDPSSDPSSNPSTDPSSIPSADPSRDPSTNPSSSPSTSSLPSSNPSSFPSSIPSSNPSYDRTFNQTISKFLNHTILVDYIKPWYYYDMRPANLTGATADIVTLQVEVDGGKNLSLSSGSPGGITSALRLHTRLLVNEDKAEVGVYFNDTNDGGLFNGMLFKDMVANGIRFEYSFFKANVTGGNKEAAPAIKLGLRSPSTGNSTIFVWEPYNGQVNFNFLPENVWVSIVVLNTTGKSNVPPIESDGIGWRNTNWLPKPWDLATLANWVTHLNTTMPNALADAIVNDVSIGVGSYNPGVTSYVNSLRIAVGDYDWKWTFGG